MYYKNKNDDLFFEPSVEVIKREQLKPISKTQFDSIWDKKNSPDSKAIEIAKARKYLLETDWVKSYELEHKLGINIIPTDSNKWTIIAKREECINMINNIDS